MSSSFASSVEVHALRLGPGKDPKIELMNFVKSKNLKAVSIVSAVGSLKVSALRYANQKEIVKLEGFREVVSLSGILGSTSGSHLHISVSDSTGVTLGGHLSEGSVVYTTLEIIIMSYQDYEFERKPDPETKYDELVIKKLK